MHGCLSAVPALLLTSSSFEACVLEHHSIFLLSPGLLNTSQECNVLGVPWHLTSLVSALSRCVTLPLGLCTILIHKDTNR